MVKDIKNVADSLEGLKEEHRLQYDYFKYATVLSLGVITAIVALFQKVISNPKYPLLIYVSLGCFAISIIGSLLAMPIITSVIASMTTFRLALLENDPNNALMSSKKIERILKRIPIFGYLVEFSLIFGIILFLVFLVFNLTPEKHYTPYVW